MGFSFSNVLGSLKDANLSFLGSSSSAKAAADADREANAANVEQVKAANDLSIQLANTAHQREIADLKAAGLNPILSAGGSGSAVPNIKAADIASLSPSILSSAKLAQDRQGQLLGVASMMAGLRVQQSQASLNSATAARTQEETKILRAKYPAVQEEEGLAAERARYRRSRPNPINKFGWDVGDALETINPFKGWFK